MDLAKLKEGGVFLLGCPGPPGENERNLVSRVRGKKVN